MEDGYSELAGLRLIEPRSAWAVGLSHFRGFALFLGIVGLAFIAIRSYGKQSLDSQVRESVEAELRRMLANSGHDCSIGSARFVAGQGLILNDVQVSANRASGSPLISIDEVAIASSCGLSDLLLKNVHVTSIDVNRAHATLERDQEGAWNIEPLVHSLTCSIEPQSHRLIPVRVRNSSLELRFATSNDTVAYSLRDIQFVAAPPAATLGGGQPASNAARLAVRGTLAGNGLDQISFAVDLDSKAQTWSASIGATAAQIDSHLLKILSQSVHRTSPSNASFRGLLDLQCSARGRWCGFAPDYFQLDGKLSEVAFQDPGLPLTIRDGRAEFRLTPDSMQAWNVSAETEQGSFRLEYRQDGSLLAPSQWRAEGIGRRLQVDRRLLPLLPSAARETFQKWSPDGLFDLDFNLSRDATGQSATLTASLIDASFEYEKFPYRLEHCSGRLHLQDDVCDIDIQSIEGDRVFRINGQVSHPGADYTGFVDVILDGQIPLDAKVFRALAAQPKVNASVRRFRATGQFGVKARFGRDTATDVTQQDFRVQLVDCSVRHERFDYPFHDVNGLLRIRNDRIDIDNVTASHGNGNVRCDGIWSRAEGLKLQFLARTVALDEQLRAALDPISKQRWTELRPRGVVDLVQVNLVQPSEDAAANVTVDAQIFAGGPTSETSLSVQPTWFPYAMHNVVGRVSIGDHAITLQGIRGEHDQAWVSFNGTGNYDDQRWDLRITDFFVSGLESNEQLLAALPAHLGQAIKRMRWQGIVNARGEIHIAGSGGTEAASTRLPSEHEAYVSTAASPPPAQPPVSLGWSLRLDSDNAAFDIGFPCEHVSGAAAINGTFDGTNLYCQGELEVDSLMLGSCQLNNIRGPIWLDSRECSVGTLARQTSAAQAPRSLVCDFYGGRLRLDGRIEMAEQQPFYLEANVSSCDLESLSDDVIPRHKNLFGTGFAAVRLKGDRTGRHSWRGAGKVHMQNARIEVPLMSAVGQVIRIADFERTVFDESNIDFEIRGDNVDLNQLEIIGSPISLIGNGKINQDRELDLDFYTILGRNKVHVPVLSDLYHVGSQQFLHIEIDGDIDSPQTHKTVLPGINEPLQKLLRDLEGRPGAAE